MSALRNEAERLAALRRYEILDCAPGQMFDDVLGLAAHICEAPAAFLTLLDENREWFKSRLGFPLAEAARDIAFCAHTVLDRDLLIVGDVLTDPRFASNPLVLREPKIRFYAGIPLVTPDGFAIGALCVIGYQPRELTSAQKQALQSLSRQTAHLIEFRYYLNRRASADYEVLKTKERLQAALEGSRLAVWDADFATGEVYLSEGWTEMLGEAPRETRTTVNELLNITHPADRERLHASAIAALKGDIPEYREEHRVRTASGEWMWIASRGRVVERNAAGRAVRMTGTNADVTERKGAEILLKTFADQLVEQAQALKEAHEKLRELSAHLVEVREAERTRIARELHDELGATLTAIKMDLSWCASHTRGKALQQRLPTLVQAVDSTIQVVKRITTELRPSILDQMGLWAAIEWQAEDFERRTGCAVACRVPDQGTPLEPERATAVFRIVQEALTNVARHARAAQVKISARADSGNILVTIEDDGRGIRNADLLDPHSWGIAGMRERAQYFGGALETSGVPEAGTRVVLRMPLGEPGSEARP